MPKMKTHRGAAKRFKRTSSGKWKHGRAYHSHILTKKTTKQKRGLRTVTVADEADLDRINRMLPYK